MTDIIETERAAMTRVCRELHGIAEKIVSTGAQHAPMLVVGTGSAEEGISMAVCSLSGLQKQHWPALMSGLITEGAKFVVLLAEAWTAQVANDDPMTGALTSGEVRVSELDQRQEAVIMQCVTFSRNIWISVCPIRVADDGQRTLVFAPPALASSDASQQWTGPFMAAASTNVTRH